jgi:uncharacterized protein YaaN involved in tellurite resistance|tara:strand:+ start:193 stop:459 length:267 start_codon:yes stop_codon:yes gene_type:complete
MGGINMNSEIEMTMLESLKKEFGETYEALEEVIVMDKLRIAQELYNKTVDDYRGNQSAKNYNMLVVAMICLQYWGQKKVKLFSLTEDF